MPSFVPSTLAAIASAALLAAPASAQSLKERRAMLAAEKAYAEAAASVSDACETTIVSGFDWDAFRSEDFESNNSIHGWCGAPLDVMRSLCTSSIDDGLGKQAVQSTIKGVTCSRGDERTIALGEDGIVTYTVTFESSNDYYWVEEWLLNNL
ncbi:MAG: hypothetical protein ACFBSD_03970 [Paracoccaceae bacterium]